MRTLFAGGTGANIVGIGTTSPSATLTVSGDMRLTGRFADSSSSTGSSNAILTSTTTGTAWVAPNALCVAITGSADLCDGNDASGGGSGPVYLATTSTWTTGNLARVASDGTVDSVATSSLGLSAAFTTSAQLAAILGDEVGTGPAVFASSTELSSTTMRGIAGGRIARFISSAGTVVLDMLSTGVNVLLGAWDFGGADSLEIVNGTNPTTDATGEIALDTTDDQLIVDNGTTDLVYRGEDVIFKFTLASTSPEFRNGGVIPIPLEKDGFSLTEYRCYVTGGTSVVVNLSDGTNDTETITCNTTASSDTDVTTNDTFTADELARVEIGAVTGAVNYLSFTAYGYWTRE
jgi:hypothetical protein